MRNREYNPAPADYEINPDAQAEIDVVELRERLESIIDQIDDGRPETISAIRQVRAELKNNPKEINTAPLQELLQQQIDGQLQQWGVNQQEFEQFGYAAKKNEQQLIKKEEVPVDDEEQKQEVERFAWFSVYKNTIRDVAELADLDNAIQTRGSALNEQPVSVEADVAEQQKEERIADGFKDLYLQIKEKQDHILFLKDLQAFEVKGGQQEHPKQPLAIESKQSAPVADREDFTIHDESEPVIIPAARPMFEYATHAVAEQAEQPKRRWLEKIFSKRKQPDQERLEAQMELEKMRKEYHSTQFNQLLEKTKQASLFGSPEEFQEFTTSLTGLQRSYRGRYEALKEQFVASERKDLAHQLQRYRAMNNLLRERNLDIARLLDLRLKKPSTPALRYEGSQDSPGRSAKEQMYKKTFELERYRAVHLIPRADFLSKKLLATRKELQGASRGERKRLEFMVRMLEAELKEAGRVMREINEELKKLPRLYKPGRNQHVELRGDDQEPSSLVRGMKGYVEYPVREIRTEKPEDPPEEQAA